jgi:general secretion pathway protein G
MKDPWGNPYEYLKIMGNGPGRGQCRKDKFLNPLNDDYDLYSKGRDGASQAPLTAQASHDDVVRASNGSFIGPALNY